MLKLEHVTDFRESLCIADELLFHAGNGMRDLSGPMGMLEDGQSAVMVETGTKPLYA